MPSSLIEVRRNYSEAEEVQLIDAVHEALVEAFKIPEEDKDVRLISYAPHRFSHRPGLSQPEFFTLVSIDCFTGRSTDAKRALYAAVVGRLSDLGIPRDHITVVLREIPTENWGIRGGQAACDVNLGFNVNV
ncbi:tautomerase family protein [Rhodococcus sp. NPDC049939]|uniref:tautomerase family protein n=1 Tax=Rhodococcus sp. NPDC049939 TaxID=3155511 RepID=UPI0033D4CF22